MRLTNNFTKQEFDSKDGAPMPPEVLLNVQKLANQLQALRGVLNGPIRINSGYRSPEHNQAVGGSKNSQHVFGKAADIAVNSRAPKQVYDIIEVMIASGNMLQGGLGLYDTFVHYDIRKTKARWDFRKIK